VVTRLLKGNPEEKYHEAMQQLTFEIGFSLYNRWKTSASHNFGCLIALLQDDKAYPFANNWPELNRLTVMDVMAHTELRAMFIQQFQDILIFDALYDNVVTNLASIAKEAMATQSLSRTAVQELLKKSLSRVMGEDEGLQRSAKFDEWLKFFLRQGHLGDLIKKSKLGRALATRR